MGKHHSNFIHHIHTHTYISIHPSCNKSFTEEMDCAAKYALERKSFGKPISGLYAIQVRSKLLL